MDVKFSNRFDPPIIKTLNFSSSNSTVSVVSVLSAKGEFYCAAFISSVTPTLYADITSQNYHSVTNNINKVQATISGLMASTTYKLFCLTAQFGAMTPFSEVLNSVQYFNTTCCKTILTNQLSAAVVQDQNAISFLTFTASSLPTVSLTIALSISNYDRKTSASNAFFPKQFHLDSSCFLGTANTIAMSSSLSSGLTVGCYSYSISLSGPSASQFTIVDESISFNRRFCIVSGDSALPAPNIASAVFFTDGSFLQIKFESMSDKGSSPNIFPCSNIFAFSCAEKSQCQWTDGQSVNAFVSGDPSCASPGSTLYIRSSVAIKAACTLTTGVCPSHSSWPNASHDIRTIQPPSNPIASNIAFNIPSIIGSCDSLVLDVTGSSGSGGRSWKSATAKVQSSCTNNIDTLNAWLNKSFTLFPPTVIPSSYFGAGCTYSISVNLCGFLGACSSKSHSIVSLNSVLPVIAIPGGSFQTIKRNSLLTLSSIVSLSGCPGDTSARTLSYSWSVSLNNIQLLDTLSVSKDLSKFILPAYSLTAKLFYSVMLMVTIEETLQSSSLVTTIFVQQGKLVPIVTGGLSRNLKVLSSLIIDASNSFDEDMFGVTGESAGLSLSWSCSQLFPILNDSCSSILSVSESMAFAFAVTSLASSEGSISQFTLSISDSSGSRSAQIVVSLQILSLDAVILSTASNIPSAVLNPSQSLQLTGTVSIPSITFNRSSFVHWVVDDADIDLSTIVLSPLKIILISPTSTFYLVIPPFSLTGRSSLKFGLTCCSGNPQYSSMISVTINSTPRLGTFSVLPVHGIEIIDVFSFSAGRWTTSNLPLSYLFGYFSSSGLGNTIQSKSLQSFTSSTLPAGNPTSNYSLTVFVNVLDTLNAFSSANSIVFVLKGKPVSPLQLFSMLGNASERSVDQIKQSIGLVASILNTINCSHSPNCSALNRLPCLKTPQTCGSCKTDSFIGDNGDSNEVCLPTKVFMRLRIQNCTTDSQCEADYACIGRRCIAPLKRCPSDCSGHGTCVFVSADSTLPLSICSVSDSRCIAQCKCGFRYSGTIGCNLNSSELQKRQNIRSQMIHNIAFWTANEYPDALSVGSWISSLSVTVQNSDEISSSSSAQLLYISKKILTLSSVLQLESASVLSVLPVIDSAVSAIGTNNGSEISIFSLLQQAGSTISSNMLPGQTAVESIQEQFRMTVSVLSEGSYDSKHSIHLPRNALEKALGIESSSISFSFQNASYSLTNGIKANSFSIRSAVAPQIAHSMYQSNPVMISLSAIPCRNINFTSNCDFEFYLPNSVAANNSMQSLNDIEVILTKCLKGKTSHATHNCSNGYHMLINCNGSFTGILNSHCPSFHQVTVCESYAGSSSSCMLQNANETGTVCRCFYAAIPLSKSTTFRRRTINRSVLAVEVNRGQYEGHNLQRWIAERRRGHQRGHGACHCGTAGGNDNSVLLPRS